MHPLLFLACIGCQDASGITQTAAKVVHGSAMETASGWLASEAANPTVGQAIRVGPAVNRAEFHVDSYVFRGAPSPPNYEQPVPIPAVASGGRCWVAGRCQVEWNRRRWQRNERMTA